MSLPTPGVVPTAKIFNQQLITALGYAGVLPMLAALLMIRTEFGLPFLELYSLAIIAFLCGSWWATCLMHHDLSGKEKRQTLLLSNSAVLAAVVAIALFDEAALLLLSGLYMALLFGEATLPAFESQPDYYRGMRQGVTALVVVIHLAAFLLL